MSVSHKFQLALNFNTLRNIGVRQTCFLQVRTVVFHKNNKKQNLTAKPYDIINLGQYEQFTQQNIATFEDDNFLSPKLLIKHTDKNVPLNCMCLFKGQIQIQSAQKTEYELYIYSQLIWFLGKEMEVVGQWKGYTKLINFDSYIDIYFSSHVLTCSIDAYAHCIISEINVKNEQKIMTIAKSSRFFSNTHIYNTDDTTKKCSQLYEASIDPLIRSYNLVVSWNKQLAQFHLSQLQIKEKARLSDVNRAQPLWKYSSLAKQNTKMKQKQLSTMLNSLSTKDYLLNLKNDSYLVSTSQFIIWKDFLNLLKRFPESNYFHSLRENYHKLLEKDHWMNRVIITDQKNQSIKQTYETKLQQLQFCSVEQHMSQIKLSNNDMQLLNKVTSKKKNRVIVLVHGYQASAFDLQVIGMYFKYRNPECHILISDVNEGMTEGVIEECGHRLAVEIKNYINARQLKDFSLSFIGHSLGGIIVRASLHYLQLYKNHFQCFVSICSPHMGYLYHTSKIVTTSIWVMNQLKKDQSMIELSMTDNKCLNKCYIYQLSERQELTWFNTIILMGSREDQYVPFCSALLENIDFFYQSQSAKIYQTMHRNITQQIQKKLVRLQILFNDKVKDLSGFIGRTAHIKVLSFLPVIDLYCHLISKRL